MNVFIALETQWLVSDGVPLGLNYASLPVVLDMLDIPRASWRDVFEGVRIMECAALEQMRKG